MYSKYLQETVGPLLAKGLAEVVEVQPQDPIEYLGLWMLHQIQKQELKEKREAQKKEQLEKQ